MMMTIGLLMMVVVEMLTMLMDAHTQAKLNIHRIMRIVQSVPSTNACQRKGTVATNTKDSATKLNEFILNENKKKKNGPFFLLIQSHKN